MSHSIQDTGKFRENLNDKFYTNPEIALQCIRQVLSYCPHIMNWIWVEPSAGNGSFLRYIPETVTRIAMDIEPEEKTIHKQDYLTWIPSVDHPYVVIGNPPFGRQSSMAKSFIRKSCSYASIIAFILPKSFTKPSMYQAFDPLFHLIHTEDLPRQSFLLHDQSYDVPCVFQISEKK
jgi:hypothetical protein